MNKKLRVLIMNNFATANIVFKSSNSRNWLLLLVTMAIFLAIGCESNKTAQCQQIFQIARSVNESYKNIDLGDDQQSIEVNSWLEAANKLNSAADNIQALQIDYSQLVEYQNQLATIYRIYSQATYDAVRARENKNLDALKLARNDAIQASKIQQNLVQEINAFCLGD
ncbi:MAG: hypothetical protein AAF383_00560 [Cyanobacteria bacterium P01_A01_bin.83]